MKRGTIRHPKLLRLARALAIEPYCALGLLEALLDWTFDYARRGDVGRFSDAEIAEAIGWRGEPAALITALVETRWLDPCERHRLVVHDLADHAHKTWKELMRRQHLEFAVAHQSPTSSPPVAYLSPPSASASASASTPLLILGADAPRVTELGFDKFWEAYPKKRHKPDGRRAWKQIDGAQQLEAILLGIAAWKGSDQWARGRIEDPATFLRQRQWEDPVPVTSEAQAVAATVALLKAEREGRT